MPWQFWFGLGLGGIAFGAIGFLLGRATASPAEPSRVLEREDEADAKADAERKEIEDDLRKRVEETLLSDEKELRDALNKDFDDMDPDRTPPAGVRKPGE